MPAAQIVTGPGGELLITGFAPWFTFSTEIVERIRGQQVPWDAASCGMRIEGDLVVMAFANGEATYRIECPDATRGTVTARRETAHFFEAAGAPNA